MKIYENKEEHLSDFIRLNEEWITEYFSLEQVDRELADNPSKIIENGGYVFSLTLGGSVVGVCALFNEGNGVFEIARMAVSLSHQGSGYGKALMKACLSKVKANKAKQVYLVSNTKLESAIALYKKFGFVATQTGQHPIYSRANIVMELNT